MPAGLRRAHLVPLPLLLLLGAGLLAVEPSEGRRQVSKPSGARLLPTEPAPAVTRTAARASGRRASGRLVRGRRARGVQNGSSLEELREEEVLQGCSRGRAGERLGCLHGCPCRTFFERCYAAKVGPQAVGVCSWSVSVLAAGSAALVVLLLGCTIVARERLLKWEAGDEMRQMLSARAARPGEDDAAPAPIHVGIVTAAAPGRRYTSGFTSA